MNLPEPRVVEIDLEPFKGIKRKASLVSLLFDVQFSRVVITWNVIPLDDDGNELITDMLRPYQRQLLADNTTFVDPTNEGNYCAPDDPNAVGEYDFYRYLAGYVPTVVEDMIVLTGSRGAALGRFD